MIEDIHATRRADAGGSLRTLGNVNRLIQELDRKVHSLPKVDENGVSECPFAEELYAQKEEAVRNLESELARMKEELSQMEREIQVAQSNLSTVSGSAGSIQLDSVQSHFDEAEQQGRIQLENLLERKRMLIEAIREAERLIAEANDKPWPGKNPPRESGPRPGEFIDEVILNDRENPNRLTTNWEEFLRLDESR